MRRPVGVTLESVWVQNVTNNLSTDRSLSLRHPPLRVHLAVEVP
jgi:hypothetical protein